MPRVMKNIYVSIQQNSMDSLIQTGNTGYQSGQLFYAKSYDLQLFKFRNLIFISPLNADQALGTDLC